MISQLERYGFLGELRVYTYKNNFRNDVPSGIQLFDQLHNLHNNPDVHIMSIENKSIRIIDFNISNSRWAEVLFKMTNPDIPDHVFSDRTSGGLRIAGRTITEDPAVSAQMVVDLNEKFDISRSYPACIENIDYLSKSLIITFLNQWMAANLSKKIIRGSEKKPKTYQPRVEFIAPASKTIQEALDNGGVLSGVKWVDNEVSSPLCLIQF